MASEVFWSLILSGVHFYGGEETDVEAILSSITKECALLLGSCLSDCCANDKTSGDVFIATIQFLIISVGFLRTLFK